MYHAKATQCDVFGINLIFDSIIYFTKLVLIFVPNPNRNQKIEHCGRRKQISNHMYRPIYTVLTKAPSFSL